MKRKETTVTSNASIQSSLAEEHCNIIKYETIYHNTNTTKAQHKYNANTIRMRCKYNTNTIQMRCKYNTNTNTNTIRILTLFGDACHGHLTMTFDIMFLGQLVLHVHSSVSLVTYYTPPPFISYLLFTVRTVTSLFTTYCTCVRLLFSIYFIYYHTVLTPTAVLAHTRLTYPRCDTRPLQQASTAGRYSDKQTLVSWAAVNERSLPIMIL